MSIYLLISFDFFDSSTVSVNGLTTNKEEAITLYDKCLLKVNNSDKLIELLEFPLNFISEVGFDIYWGNLDKHPEVKIIKSNNRN